MDYLPQRHGGTPVALPSGVLRPQVGAEAINQRAPLKLSVCAGVTGPAECPTRRTLGPTFRHQVCNKTSCASTVPEEFVLEEWLGKETVRWGPG